MSTVEFWDHIATIFFDLVLPALVLWIGWQIRKWLPAEAAAHVEVKKIADAVQAKK